MEQIPEAMQYSMSLQPADVMDADVEEDTRKRKRIEARRRFRILTSTIVAVGRFRVVLEVDAEKPEQAESEILASLGNLGLQPLSEESVKANIARDQGQCSTHPRAEGTMITLPNTAGYGSPFIPHEGYSMTALQKDRSHKQAGETVTMQYGTYYETISSQNHAYSPVELRNSGQYQQNEGEITILPTAISGPPEFPNQEHSTIQRQESVQYEQEVWKFLNKPDLTNEDFGTPASEEGGVNETSRRLSSDWERLKNLSKMDGNTQHWATLASELNAEITRKIQDLESGSGRTKVQKLYKDAEEITKRIGIVGSASEGKKSQKMQPKATSNALPTIRDIGQYVSEIFEKLKLQVNELTDNMHGRQKQASSLTVMARLIEDGRKALITLGRGTDWISEKLATLQKGLKFRELTVDRHFQKCAEVMPALVDSFLKVRKGNFISMNSLIDWYFEEMSFRKDQKDSSSSDFDEFLSVF